MRGDADGMQLRGDLPGGRRELRLRVGSFSVVVEEIPGRSLTPLEWWDIVRARGSYRAMWGGDGSDMLMNDPLDGRDASSCYRAWHYRACVRDGEGPWKLVVMRKTALDPSALTAEQRADPGELLPADVRWWTVRAGGECFPLWEALRAGARRLAPRDEHAALRIASMGRVATYPYGERKRTEREREKTAIAFAAIQLLATHGDSSLLHMWLLCPELRDRVVGVRDVEDEYVTPDFTRTEDVLGLPAGAIRLDNSLSEVREHKASFPGYFIDNDDAARCLAAMMDEGRITVADLGTTICRLVAGESPPGGDGRLLDELVALVGGPDHGRLAEILTTPRLFKYLIPVLSGAQRLSRMSAAEFRDRLVCETRDGPFSAAVMPARWAASAWAVLEAAEAKYTRRPVFLPAATELEPVLAVAGL